MSDIRNVEQARGVFTKLLMKEIGDKTWTYSDVDRCYEDFYSRNELDIVNDIQLILYPVINRSLNLDVRLDVKTGSHSTFYTLKKEFLEEISDLT